MSTPVIIPSSDDEGGEQPHKKRHVQHHTPSITSGVVWNSKNIHRQELLNKRYLVDIIDGVEIFQFMSEVDMEFHTNHEAIPARDELFYGFDVRKEPSKVLLDFFNSKVNEPRIEPRNEGMNQEIRIGDPVPGTPLTATPPSLLPSTVALVSGSEVDDDDCFIVGGGIVVPIQQTICKLCGKCRSNKKKPSEPTDVISLDSDDDDETTITPNTYSKFDRSRRDMKISESENGNVSNISRTRINNNYVDGKGGHNTATHNFTHVFSKSASMNLNNPTTTDPARTKSSENVNCNVGTYTSTNNNNNVDLSGTEDSHHYNSSTNLNYGFPKRGANDNCRSSKTHTATNISRIRVNHDVTIKEGNDQTTTPNPMYGFSKWPCINNNDSGSENPPEVKLSKKFSYNYNEAHKESSNPNVKFGFSKEASVSNKSRNSENHTATNIIPRTMTNRSVSINHAFTCNSKNGFCKKPSINSNEFVYSYKEPEAVASALFDRCEMRDGPSSEIADIVITGSCSLAFEHNNEFSMQSGASIDVESPSKKKSESKSKVEDEIICLDSDDDVSDSPSKVTALSKYLVSASNQANVIHNSVSRLIHTSALTISAVSTPAPQKNNNRQNNELISYDITPPKHVIPDVTLTLCTSKRNCAESNVDEVICLDSEGPIGSISVDNTRTLVAMHKECSGANTGVQPRLICMEENSFPVVDAKFWTFDISLYKEIKGVVQDMLDFVCRQEDIAKIPVLMEPYDGSYSVNHRHVRRNISSCGKESCAMGCICYCIRRTLKVKRCENYHCIFGCTCTKEVLRPRRRLSSHISSDSQRLDVKCAVSSNPRSFKSFNSDYKSTTNVPRELKQENPVIPPVISHKKQAFPDVNDISSLDSIILKPNKHSHSKTYTLTPKTTVRQSPYKTKSLFKKKNFTRDPLNGQQIFMNKNSFLIHHIAASNEAVEDPVQAVTGDLVKVDCSPPAYALTCLTPGIGYVILEDFCSFSLRLRDPFQPSTSRTFTSVKLAAIWLNQRFREHIDFDEGVELVWLVANSVMIERKKIKRFDKNVLLDPRCKITKSGVIFI